MDEILIDSKMNLDEALDGLDFPSEIRERLSLIDIDYFSFDRKIHRGQMVVNSLLSDEIAEIFKNLFRQKFPIAKISPISKYGWSDEKSMEINNTSCFNYRKIYKTDRLSAHSYGRAIDINPVFNPYVAADGSVWPKNAIYDANRAGTILKNGEITRIFEKFGWAWGGNWEDRKDWQHFEKN